MPRTRDKSHIRYGEITENEGTSRIGQGLPASVCPIHHGRHANTPSTINTMLGKKHSEATILKMSEAAKGRVISPDARAKMSASAKVRISSDETKAKIGAASKGNTYALGFRHSSESRAKISASQLGVKRGPYNICDERREKLSIASKLQWAKRKAIS